MFCMKCGTQLPDGTAFCNSCGAPQGNVNAAPAPAQQTAPQRTVTIRREGMFGTGSMSVLIDDGEYATLAMGETKSFQIPGGVHRLQVLSTSYSVGGYIDKNTYKSDVIFIQETDGDTCFSIKMSMTGKMRLTRTK